MRQFLEYLKLEADFDYLVDITAVDWPKRAERFDLVYILYSFSRNHRLRVKTYLGDSYKPETATGVHLTANWLEREVYDMFGIEFAGTFGFSAKTVQDVTRRAMGVKSLIAS